MAPAYRQPHPKVILTWVRSVWVGPTYEADRESECLWRGCFECFEAGVSRVA